MRMLPGDRDLAENSDRMRIVWVLSGAVLLPATLMLIGATGHPEWGLIVIAAAFAAAWIAGQVRGRRTRERTDERALATHRRAASFSWQVMAVVLTLTAAWMDVRHGIGSAEPYLILAVALVTSYVAASMWWRWRGL